jgi:L,D-transpeptidase ErfK/SrfK
MAVRFVVLIIGCLLINVSFGARFAMPKSGDSLVGVMQTTKMGHRNITQIMQHYDVGLDALKEANPNVNFDQLSASTSLTIPTQFILPMVSRRGMVVNLAALRLMLYLPKAHSIEVLPVGVGKAGAETPIFKTNIISKAKNPDWVPTASVRQAFLDENGYPMPLVVPSNEQNPLGYYAMRLSDPTYLMHGTIDPAGVGSRVSAGCLRMFNEDNKTIFHLCRIGTRVNIINEPYKAGWQGKTLYLEAHAPISKDQWYKGYKTALDQARHHRRGRLTIDWQKVKDTVSAHTGIPVAVGSVA